MSPDISADESAASTTSTRSSGGRTSGQCRAGRGMCQGKGKWSPFNIFAMVLGFVLFWPIGLLLLFWILSGRDVRELPAVAQRKWQAFSQQRRQSDSGDNGGNTVFNAYQQTQWDRIREIKGEIRERGKRFMNFREDAKRRADEKEFHEFMNSQPVSEKAAPK